MITEEAPASPLALTAREKVPKFVDLLWDCFGGASRSRKFRGLRILLLRPHRAPIRHPGKTRDLRKLRSILACCVLDRADGEIVSISRTIHKLID